MDQNRLERDHFTGPIAPNQCDSADLASHQVLYQIRSVTRIYSCSYVDFCVQLCSPETMKGSVLRS